jgi:DNA-binding transcriptional MerR regulator
LEKAPDAFRTISEVADEIDVPQHVLRFWESRFPQIRPMKRGGGRRYYRPDDVDLLRGVRHLLYGEGYTIRGVQRILREQGVTFVQTIWSVDQDAPPLDADDDDEAGEEAAATRSEPNLFAVAPPRAQQPPIMDPMAERREPTIVPPISLEQSPPEQPSPPMQPSSAQPPAEEPPSSAIAAEDRRKLQAALEELVACRGILETALRQQ